MCREIKIHRIYYGLKQIALQLHSPVIGLRGGGNVCIALQGETQIRSESRMTAHPTMGVWLKLLCKSQSHLKSDGIITELVCMFIRTNFEHLAHTRCNIDLIDVSVGVPTMR